MGGVKKSVYVFLCSLLGVLLFLVLHRIGMMLYVLLVIYGVFQWASTAAYIQFLAFDYVTLLLAMLCGSWYGIWLGNYWYEQVYELGAWSGAWRHFRHQLMPAKTRHTDLRNRVEVVKQQLAEDLSHAQLLVGEIPQEILKPIAIKRRAVRKKPGITIRKSRARKASED